MFDSIKKVHILISDLNNPINIQTYILDIAVDEVFMQDQKAVSFASHIWDNCQNNHAPTEREMKAIVFRLHQFSDYCDGRYIAEEPDIRLIESKVFVAFNLEI